MGAVQSGDRTYGLPAASIPNFMLYNAPAFQAAGLQYPKTWEEFVAAGRVLNERGVKIYNLAGEDYTKPIVQGLAQRLLRRADARATHYEIVMTPRQTAPKG